MESPVGNASNVNFLLPNWSHYAGGTNGCKRKIPVLLRIYARLSRRKMECNLQDVKSLGSKGRFWRRRLPSRTIAIDGERPLEGSSFVRPPPVRKPLI